MFKTNEFTGAIIIEVLKIEQTERRGYKEIENKLKNI